MIRHIVAVRFDSAVSADEKVAVFEELAALKNIVDGALDFQVRRNVSPEAPVVRGLNDLFWFDFRDEAARDAYLVHPAHKQAGARLVAACHNGVDGITVLDFEV